MARLKHAVSGVVVSVADEKADRLGNEWLPVDGGPSVEVVGSGDTGNSSGPHVHADLGTGVEPDPEPDPEPEPEPEKPAKSSRYRK